MPLLRLAATQRLSGRQCGEEVHAGYIESTGCFIECQTSGENPVGSRADIIGPIAVPITLAALSINPGVQRYSA